MDPLSVELLGGIFRYLKQINLIEVSAVCKKWYRVVISVDFCLKIKETNSLFYDKDWLLKTYYKHFERFKDSVCFECVGILHYHRLHTIERNILNKMFYSVLPFRVWSHFWLCSRYQNDPKICQHCTKLQIRNLKVVNYINKKLLFDVRRLFPLALNSTVVYVPTVSCLFT